ncbi:hypothetical protein ALC62_06121 [Cyphomyrmex costatus]|uniref:Uncharacterized protein n=1 Tax=Cyphomyrmex costatus TaxID=456900 RepID=A0A195CRA5_9HYME|nr:hypothetical protein ALC62_06121 [Cyphomyrmex costatus]
MGKVGRPTARWWKVSVAPSRRYVIAVLSGRVESRYRGNGVAASQSLYNCEFILGRIDRPREVSWYRGGAVLSQPNYRCRLYHRYMGNRQLSNEHGEPVQQVSQESGSRTQVTIDRIRLSVWLDQ